jgi:hypothetical protein
MTAEIDLVPAPQTTGFQQGTITHTDTGHAALEGQIHTKLTEPVRSVCVLPFAIINDSLISFHNLVLLYFAQSKPHLMAKSNSPMSSKPFTLMTPTHRHRLLQRLFPSRSHSPTTRHNLCGRHSPCSRTPSLPDWYHRITRRVLHLVSRDQSSLCAPRHTISSCLYKPIRNDRRRPLQSL